MQREIRVGRSESIYEDALTVRKTVFVEEQGVDPEIEVDEHDETAIHLAAYDDGEPVGAGRFRTLDDRTGKVERIAVLADYRDGGLGRAIMGRIEEIAREEGVDRLVLHSQTRAAPFYARVGYEQVGEEFEEAGIPHVEMRTEL
ncbi:GNAT family N-acetyltransferase [Halapricum salinum]|uniref:GNAT family N-acetyltransferase n=1 Tax=Halapricum salinum TaxID=1457250 RepID=A0A4D6H9L3_9EURY|nr:GNAT family N-acetyltransferase [Halapricum salinum]QCC50490.1 GNAT family N-acetyltransferase [Halapricum salinum]